MANYREKKMNLCCGKKKVWKKPPPLKLRTEKCDLNYHKCTIIQTKGEKGEAGGNEFR